MTALDSADDVFGLWQLFREARFIHLFRDAQEVVHSSTNLSRITGGQQTEHQAYEVWRDATEAYVQVERAFGSRVVRRVHYRELVHHPQAALRRCFEFVGQHPAEAPSWPLRLLGDEPRLGETYHRTDKPLREHAKRLSADLAAEGAPCYDRDQDDILALKAQFLARCTRTRGGRRPTSHRIRETVALYLPPQCTVAVVSRADDALLDLGDYRSLHFPEDDHGGYAGYHPADGADAVARLEALADRGAEFLLIPADSFWWLEYCQDFATFLGERCQIIAYVEHTCAIFALRPIEGHPLRMSPDGLGIRALVLDDRVAVSTDRPHPVGPANDRAFADRLSAPRPRDSAELSGSIWAITCFFNPHGHRNKSRHYRLFRQGLQCAGVPLLTSELAFGDAPFELTARDADRLIQLPAEDVLWHKERLLNLSLDRLPDGCDKVAWIDCDVLLANPRWVGETLTAVRWSHEATTWWPTPVRRSLGPSVVHEIDGALSTDFRARMTFARMSDAFFVQIQGLGFSLWCRM